MHRVWRGAAALILAALFAVTVYRAATQSITHDEAVTLRDFVAGPFAGLFVHYDANNHVLYSLLARVSIAAFGTGELSLRLPALLGAALLLGALFVLVRGVFGDTWWLPATVTAVACNSYLLDFLPLARGYGLGCGLFVMALAMVSASGALPVRWTRVGVVLGLSVAANLTLLIPVAALCATLAVRHGWKDAARCAVAGAIVCAAIVGGPMRNAERGNFYYGADNAWNALASLVGGSIYHNVNDRGDVVTEATAGVAIALALVIACGLLARPRDGFLFLVAGIGAGVFALTAAAHMMFGLPLPFGRTGLYWILIFGLGTMALAQRFLRPAGVVVAGLAAAACYHSWTINAAADWEYDAGTKAIAQRMKGLRHVAASWPLEPALNYYRTRLGLDATLTPISRELAPAACNDCDGYAVFGDDLAVVSAKKLRVVYEDPVARSVLAVTPDGGAR